MGRESIKPLLALVPMLFGAGVHAAEIACEGGRAGEYPCRSVNRVAHMPAGDIGGGPLNDIWGWTAGDGREIAIVGRYSGTSFIDISDPENPVFLGALHAHDGHAHAASSGGATTNGGDRRRVQHETESTWRDVKVYEHYALIVSEESGHGMQVFDLSTLPAADASDLPRELTETAHYDRFGSAHNIAVNTDSGYAYVVGSTSGAYPYNGGLHIIDLNDPLDPQRAGGFSVDGYTHDVQCVNYNGPDQAYAGRELCLASNEDTLTVVDVTVKSAPSLVSRTGYPGAYYTHQGWLSDDHRYFFVNDEADESTTGLRTRTLVWDVTDPDAPELVRQYLAPSHAADHNHYVNGRFLFQSNYLSGLRVLDIAHPESPLEIGYFDTQPGRDEPIYEGTWSNYPYFPSGVVALSDVDDGLFLLRPTVVSATATADLSVGIEGPDRADSGDALSFELSVVNNGPQAAPGVELVFSLPAGALSADIPAECEVQHLTVICRPGDMVAGAAYQAVLSASVNGSGRLSAVVFAAAQVDEQDTRDNRRVHEVFIHGSVDPPSVGGDGGGSTGPVFGLIFITLLTVRIAGRGRRR